MAEVKFAIQPGMPFHGIGVIRHPDATYVDEKGVQITARQYAQEMAAQICQGSCLVLPNVCDEHGNYVWDFRIEGGDAEQVTVERFDPAALEIKAS